MNDSIIKVMHVTFTMGIGGTEQVIRQIIENSDTDKFQHEILCIDGEIGQLGQELKERGIHIECIKRQQGGVDLKLLKFMKILLKRREINVLHCHQYTPYFYGVLSTLRTKIRVIFTEHGRFYPDRHNFKRRFINPLLTLGTDYITTISKSTADAVAKYEYIPRSKIQIIYNGIKDIETFGRTRDDLLSELGLSDDFRYIGTISRLARIKNQTMMINAFFNIKKIFPDVKLVLIGDGEKMQDLKELARSLGLENDIIFTGFINNPQQYIRLFDIFLLSSFSEGTSMTLLEAMSLSRPCVVTDVGGNPEIVLHGKTGLITPSDDVEAFSCSVIQLLMDDKKIDEYGKAGRERFIKYYSAAHMADEYQSLYAGA
jgi:glycosyltransferase involved in cell wall biosynthesis